MNPQYPTFEKMVEWLKAGNGIRFQTQYRYTDLIGEKALNSIRQNSDGSISAKFGRTFCPVTMSNGCPLMGILFGTSKK